MRRLRTVLQFFVVIILVAHAPSPHNAMATDRAATVGAQTLDEIMARQKGVAADNTVRPTAIGNPENAAAMTAPLGALGGASDPDLWRALRFGTANVNASHDGPGAKVLIQDGGTWWWQFRKGPLSSFAVYLLAGMMVLLVAFFLLRGRIQIDGEKTGHKILRFKKIERAGHWLLAGSFILLGVTGIISLFGRTVLIPLLGHEAFAFLAAATKWIHNYVGWVFMASLVIIFVLWVRDNLPDRTDITWLRQGGGLFTKDHPPAKKFNAGQKLIFWAVILLGGSISMTGLALLIPFEINMFAGTFKLLNSSGLPQLFSGTRLPEMLAPHEEMQFAQLWHAIISFVLLAIILAHIYIGSIGMEGAYDAMGSGKVDAQWARQHHAIWTEELMAPQPPAANSKPPRHDAGSGPDNGET